MTGHDGVTGVGIFTKRLSFWRSKKEGTVMKIELILPEGKKPLHLKGLIADLPNFSFNVGNLTNAVQLKSVSFRTSNSPVNVASLSAEDAKMRTSNGAIRVTSLFSSTLDLHTSNAGISGEFNTSGSLSITTSNTRPSTSPLASRTATTRAPRRST